MFLMESVPVRAGFLLKRVLPCRSEKWLGRSGEYRELESRQRRALPQCPPDAVVIHLPIALRNSLLDFVPFILSRRNSIPSSGVMGASILRRIQTLFRTSSERRSSSRRVPERLISMAGKTRFSERWRSR